jgi:hypothetical protein
MKVSAFLSTTVLWAAVLCLSGAAHETETKLPSPGFRPGSEHASAFLNTLRFTTVDIYPTVVRTPDATSYSASSQRRIVSLLNGNGVTTAVARTEAIDPGELKGRSQWDIFQNDMQTLAEEIKARESDADHSLVVEVLFPPSKRKVFGIHCYVWDRQGRNAFSFLLNSHHRLFVDANLIAEDASEASRAALVEMATPVAVTALIQQIEEGDDYDGALLKEQYPGERDDEARLMEELDQPVEEYMDLAKAGDEEKAKQSGAEIYSKIEKHPRLLNMMSSILLTAPDLKFRDIPLALKSAERANSLTKGESFKALDTYARALWESGRKEEAVRHQEQALKLAPAGKAKAEMHRTLDAYTAGETPPPE